jgi:hypothetical protein
MANGTASKLALVMSLATIRPEPPPVRLPLNICQPRQCMDQSRNTRAGSVRVARQAGRRQAATEVIVITATADANASGSFGLTL